jgi:GDP-mannose 6-dehydrogenase
MKIGIIGLGYVGITSAACFLKLGHKVVGVEKSLDKIKTLRSGLFPIVEPGISELFQMYSSNFSACSDIELSLNSCDCIMVAVGTPTSDVGESDLSAMGRVIEGLSKIIKTDVPILIRSTIPIGTSRVYAGKNPSLNIVFHPEFLREGTAVEDFFNPPKIVFGTKNSQDESLLGLVKGLYPNFTSPFFNVSYESAESVKYADNIFHALKVSFTNEIVKSITKKGADPKEVMNIFCSDTHLNVSPVYLKPGFAYGGSCLEKDLYSFRYQNSDSELPLLNSITVSNEQVIDDFFYKIKDLSGQVVINGLSFKERIDDVRRSPFVALTRKLLDHGNTVYAYDDNLNDIFGESLDIINDLKKYKNFHLNKRTDISKLNTTVVYSHRQKHSLVHEKLISDFDLFVGGDIAKVYR